MIEDYKRRFFISLILTIPILLLSPLIQEFFGLEFLKFNGDMYVLFILSSIVYFYGGYLFLKGIFNEIRVRSPGMMTLIAIGAGTDVAVETADIVLVRSNPLDTVYIVKLAKSTIEKWFKTLHGEQDTMFLQSLLLQVYFMLMELF